MAYFEVDGQSFAARVDGVPAWIRHFAMNVDSEEELHAWKERIESHGVEVRGVVDHEGIWQSLYFFDPNGLRLELTWQRRQLTEDDRLHGEELVQQWIAEHSQVGS
jgi:catechol-2,3-dioxygenase